MEISSNASSGKHLQGSQSQFSFSTDSQQGSAFDLLLSLPIAPSPTVEPGNVEESVADHPSVNSTCQDCDSAAEQKQESESSEEAESTAEESAQANIASSVAAIDTIVAHQSQSVEQPNNREAETANSVVLPKTDATQPAQAIASQAATEISTVGTLNPGVQSEPVSPQEAVATVADDSTAQATQAQVVQAASDTPSNQQQSSDNGQSQQTIPSKQEQPAGEMQEIINPTSGAVAPPKETQPPEVGKTTKEAAASKNQAEAARRGQQRERPARWYEREASQTQVAGVETEQLQAAEENIASPIEAIEQVDFDQPADHAQHVQTEGDAIGVEAIATLTASTTADSTTGLPSSIAIPSASTVEAASDSSSEATRSMASALERTTGKASVNNDGKLESSQTGTQVDITRAEKVRLVQRVARSFSRIGPSGGSLQIRLHPPELGALAVQVRIEGKNMTARLTTESQAARDVIMESLPQLRSRLAEQGYEVVQFTVDVTSDGSSLSNQSEPGQGGAGQGGAGQGGAGQGGHPGNSSDNSTQQSPFELRRSNYLRRQLDSANLTGRARLTSGSGSGVDIQA